jgi:hypothetical protein
MLNVHNDELVIEEKGVYSVEHFLTSRRLMYWQVYLHKTGLGAEHLLQSVFKRVRELLEQNVLVELPKSLSYFFRNDIAIETFDAEILEQFASLDDTDLICVLKLGMKHEDFVFRELCTMILNRQLLKIKFTKSIVAGNKLEEKKKMLMDTYNITAHEASYFVFSGSVGHCAYAKAKPLNILKKSGKVVELTTVGEHAYFKALTKNVVKHYYCYPKVQD